MQKLKHIAIFIALLLPTLLTGVYIYAYSPTFTLIPRAQDNRTDLAPDASFTIYFDKPVVKEHYQNHVSLSPQTPMTAAINATHTAITLTPKSTWKVGQQYTVSIPRGRAKNFMQIDEASYAFTVTQYPTVIDVVPIDGSTDVRLDIEDPITVQFDKSTEGFFVDFRLEPTVTVKYQHNARKTQFEILPQEPLSDNTTYTLHIRVKALGAADSTYTPLHTTTFTTIEPKPKTWAENLQERLVEAKKFTTAQITDGKYIDVNLATQIMTIFDNGRLLDAFLISSGKPGMNTPQGTHQIYNKHPRPWSKQYGLYMPYWMAITSDGKYGIHELPEWPGGYKEGQNHLGIPVSHGCMRLGIGPAETLYNWAEIGTPVIIY
jgi:lipoprotein-anchoring transpeptidase ErfK/SrfK